MQENIYEEIFGTEIPHHYQLLGLKLFESDKEIIHKAGLMQMKKLKAWDLHEDEKVAEKVKEIHSQLGRAIAILYDWKKKSEYDKNLAKKLGVELPGTPKEPRIKGKDFTMLNPKEYDEAKKTAEEKIDKQEPDPKPKPEPSESTNKNKEESLKDRGGSYRINPENGKITPLKFPKTLRVPMGDGFMVHVDAKEYIKENQPERYDRLFPEEDISEELHQACHDGDLQTVRILLEDEINLNSVGDDGNCPLHIACLKGYTEIAQELIDAGADMQILNAHAGTPLHLACLNGNIRTAIALLDADVDINIINTLGSTPLLFACLKNQANTVKWLLKEGANPDLGDFLGSTPLHTACLKDYYETASALLDGGAYVDARSNNGNTPLFYAIKHPATVDVLIEWDADLFAENDKGETPILKAFEEDCYETLELFIDANEDVESELDALEHIKKEDEHRIEMSKPVPWLEYEN